MNSKNAGGIIKGWAGVLGVLGIIGGLIAGGVFQVSVTNAFGYDYTKYNTLLASICAASSIIFWIVLHAIGMVVQALEDSKAKLDKIIYLLQTAYSDELDDNQTENDDGKDAEISE